MAGLVRRVPVWQILPASSGSKHPEDATENVARIAPRPASAIVAPWESWDQGGQQLPLLVRKVHASYDPQLRRACPYL